MSRPKAPKSKPSRPKTPPSTNKPPTQPAKLASSSTPDENAKGEHGEHGEHGQPRPKDASLGEERPWSEWQWCEEGQVCYRGRKDLKGEWEYDLAPLPKEKERPYTPPKAEPIEYLIEELMVIWQASPLQVPGSFPVAKVDAPKKSAERCVGAEKVEVVSEEDGSEKDDEEKITKTSEKDSTTTTSTKKPEKHEKHEKPTKERLVERRGRQLERKHFSSEEKDKKAKIDKWRKEVEKVECS